MITKEEIQRIIEDTVCEDFGNNVMYADKAADLILKGFSNLQERNIGQDDSKRIQVGRIVKKAACKQRKENLAEFISKNLPYLEGWQQNELVEEIYKIKVGI